MNSLPACNVCGTASCRAVATLTSDIDNKEYTAVKCLTCGLVFAFPMPVLDYDELQELYDEEYTQSQRALSSDEENALLRAATHRQMDIVERYVSKGKALNIGVMGEAITVLKDRGWDLHVVEVSSYAAETAQNKWGLNVTVSRIEDYEVSPDTYQFIKLGHVIEHLADPRVVIEKLTNFLRPGGVILIDTDNAHGLKTRVEVMARQVLGEKTAGHLVKSLTGKNLHKRYGRLTPPEHVYTFTEKSLVKLLTTLGYEILKVYKPAWGDDTWFPLENKKNFSLLERGFLLADQIGARFGAGEVVAVLARKPPTS